MRPRIIDKPKLWSNEWFECWQPLILLGVNSPFKGMREDVRNRLGIRLDRNILIDRLMRNSFRIKVGENEYQEVFYSKPFFAIALKREWMWLWQLIHKWDMNFANNLIPRLNLGFDTLIVRPDADPETRSCDGYVARSGVNQSFSNIRIGSGTAGAPSVSGGIAGRLSASSTTNSYSVMARGVMLFDSSTLTADVEVSNGVVSLYARSISANGLGGSPEIDIVSSNPASNTNLVAGDYDYTLFGTTVFASLGFSSWDSDGYKDFTLDSNGISNISLTGVSKFGTRIDWDTDNSFGGSWVSDAVLTFYVYNAEQGVDYAPKLTVTYTLPSNLIPMNIQNIMTQIRM